MRAKPGMIHAHDALVMKYNEGVAKGTMDEKTATEIKKQAISIIREGK
jgi:hypothetical protein